MKKSYAILNSLIIIAVIFANTFASIRGLNGNTVGGISDKYNTLFAPAGYAFSIWGIIYIGLIVFGVFQLIRAFGGKKEYDGILETGPWLSIANIANIIWLWAWLNEYLLLSVILMLLILAALLVMIIRLNMQRWDAPFPVIAFVWWPIGLYSGWISVATVANISAYLVKIDWIPLFSDLSWTYIMIVVATFINLLMIQYRNMRLFAAVGVWALVAISIRHWDSAQSLQWTALLSAIIIFLGIVGHGIKNWSSNSISKFRAYYLKQ